MTSASGATSDETPEFVGAAPLARARRETPRALPPGQSIGRYTILGLLGQGGMGVVYAAYDAQLDRKVAVKLLRHNTDDGPARLLREAQAMAKLTHVNVVAVFDAGLADDRVFVAMEFVGGQNLAEWLRAEPRPWREIVQRFAEAGRGLAAVHEAGMVHRDFKPENVLIGDDGRCRVTDFGLARLAATEPHPPRPVAGPALTPATISSSLLETALTQYGAVAGTPAYMAPEQWRGAAPDALTDQYSFGVSLYRALYGDLPYDLAQLQAWTPEGGGLIAREPATGQRGSPPSTQTRRVRAAAAADAASGPAATEPPAASTAPVPSRGDSDPVPRWVWRTLARSLQLKPEDRYPRLDILLDALARDPARRRRRRLGQAASVAVVAGSLAVALGAARGTARSAPQLCRDADHQLVGVWDDDSKQAVRAAFVATGGREGPEIWNRTEAVLDRYAQSWTAAQTDACEAARVRGDQSDETYTLRTVCLDADLKQLRSLVQIFRTADGDVTNQAVQAASGLATVSRCADVDALVSSERPPAEPTARRQYDEAKTSLGEAIVLNLAGRSAAAEQLAQAIVAQTRDRFHGLEAKAQILLATILVDSGRHDAGVRATNDALVAAEASLDSATAVKSYAILLFQAGLLGHADDVAMLKRHGEAWLSHAKGEERDDAAGSFLNSLGALSFYAGRWTEAATYFTQAYDAYARVRPGHWLLARNLNNRAEALLRAGSYAEADATAERALAIKSEALGVNHPELISTLNLAARIQLALHADPRAIGLARRSVALVSGEASRLDRADALQILGEAYARDPAQEDRAAAVLRDSLGLTADASLRLSDVRATTLHQLANLLLRRNAAAEAVPMYEESLAIRERSQGQAGPQVAESLIGLGCAYTMLGQAARATAAFSRASAIAGPAAARDAAWPLAQRLFAVPEARVAAERLTRHALAATDHVAGSQALDSIEASCLTLPACRRAVGQRTRTP